MAAGYGGFGAGFGGPAAFGRGAVCESLIMTVADVIGFPTPVRVPLCSYSGQSSENLRVTMMPFNCDDVMSLPSFCNQYRNMINACLSSSSGRKQGMIGYLTIVESPVQAGESQERVGIKVQLKYVKGGLTNFKTLSSPMRGFDGGMLRGNSNPSSSNNNNNNNSAMQPLQVHANILPAPRVSHSTTGSLGLQHAPKAWHQIADHEHSRKDVHARITAVLQEKRSGSSADINKLSNMAKRLETISTTTL